MWYISVDCLSFHFFWFYISNICHRLPTLLALKEGRRDVVWLNMLRTFSFFIFSFDIGINYYQSYMYKYTMESSHPCYLEKLSIIYLFVIYGFFLVYHYSQYQSSSRLSSVNNCPQLRWLTGLWTVVISSEFMDVHISTLHSSLWYLWWSSCFLGSWL